MSRGQGKTWQQQGHVDRQRATPTATGARLADWRHWRWVGRDVTSCGEYASRCEPGAAPYRVGMKLKGCTDCVTHQPVDIDITGTADRNWSRPLLVVDAEVGHIPFETEAANLFSQLVSSRYERAA